MEWIENLLTVLLGALSGLGGSILYFRPKLKEAKADAAMKQTDAQKHEFDSLVEKIQIMENLYKEQSEMVSNLSKEVLAMTEEKHENEKRIISLEKENQELQNKVAKLEKELDAYKKAVDKETKSRGKK